MSTTKMVFAVAGGVSVLLFLGLIGLAIVAKPARPEYRTELPPPRQDPTIAAARAAEEQRTVEERTQHVAALNAQADADQEARAKRIKHYFPVKQNAIDDCIAQHGGPRELSPDFYFGRELSIAYKLNLGGSEPLAQRFINHISAASRCTAFSSSTIERALLPALPHLRRTDEITTLIALAGDVCAQAADSSDECFTTKVRALNSLLR